MFWGKKGSKWAEFGRLKDAHSSFRVAKNRLKYQLG
jgi:hypothetical protein